VAPLAAYGGAACSVTIGRRTSPTGRHGATVARTASGCGAGRPLLRLASGDNLYTSPNTKGHVTGRSDAQRDALTLSLVGCR
jgi:hypothetical protein